LITVHDASRAGSVDEALATSVEQVGSGMTGGTKRPIAEALLPVTRLATLSRRVVPRASYIRQIQDRAAPSSRPRFSGDTDAFPVRSGLEHAHPRRADELSSRGPSKNMRRPRAQTQFDEPDTLAWASPNRTASRLSFDLGQQIDAEPVRHQPAKQSSGQDHTSRARPAAPIGPAIRDQPVGAAVLSTPHPALTADQSARDGLPTTGADGSGSLMFSGAIIVDGRELGRIVASGQARTLTKPPVGTRALNLRATPIGPGLGLPPP
jgi:hypothetical protein